ncbi:MAG: tRNA uridine-5-carboxymethylaminomethyl(34) synthesis GTPase MnmE, partial [Bacteroidota bacterium]
ADGKAIDQVVVTLFRAPRSATGEDVAEVTTHGGNLAPQLVLRRILDAGARLAEPGEFTRRGFLNGKLDLAQAEAVADLIHASSSLAHRVSMSHLRGHYSDAIRDVRQRLLSTAALIELELDFAEEDVEFADKSQLEALLSETEALLTSLLGSYRLGALVRDGVRVVIGGRPNAGKSTLLNALVGRDRAIVSDIPGTTRDEIEAEAEIDGLLFRFVDTAGLRETSDAIEAEGVRRAERSIGTADALLYVFDATLGLDAGEQDFLSRLASDQPRLPVVQIANKIDLVGGVPSGGTALALSAGQAGRDPQALGALRETLVEEVAGRLDRAQATPIVVNERHRQHLTLALDAVHRAQGNLHAAGGDTLALDLRVALHELGGITGEITTEDILGEIFSRFCIGK